MVREIYHENACSKSAYWFDRNDFDHRIDRIITCIGNRKYKYDKR